MIKEFVADAAMEMASKMMQKSMEVSSFNWICHGVAEVRESRMWRRFGVKVLAPVRLAKVDDSG